MKELETIRAKCEELITRDDHRGPGTSILDMPASPEAIAGWRSTMAIIDCLTLILGCLEGENLHSRELETAEHLAFEIISAWRGK